MHDRAERVAWFKATILPHESALRKRVRRMATTPDIEADDIVSETLLRAYASENFERVDRGDVLLFTIARNLIADIARHRSVVPFDMMLNIETLDLIDPAPTPESAAVARDELRRLQELVKTLPTQPRQVFVLRRIQELSLQEIAVRLDLSVSTVEKHLSKAMAVLTQAMTEEDPVPSVKKGWIWRRAKEQR